MAEFQSAIRVDKYGSGNRYVYACHTCGKEVAGYHNKRVRGHVYCIDCFREKQKAYQNGKYNGKIAKIKSIILEGEQTDIGRQITLERIKEVL